MRKVVVLGGTGFLGAHVMALLSQKRIPAISMSRKEGVDLSDLSEFVCCLKAEEPDAVINCAAHVGSLHYVTTYAADVIHDNATLILNTYRSTQQACPNARIVNPISNCSYPGDADIQRESEWERGPIHESVLAYGASKRLLYAVAESYRKQHGTCSINWIVPNAYGPGDYIDPNKVHALNGILIRLIQAQVRGDHSFQIWGTGRPLREWVYIADVARVMVDSLSIEPEATPMNLAQNKAYSIADIAKMGADALGYKVRFEFDTSKPDGAPIKQLDDRLFRERYPDFRFTPISEGVERTIAYYKSVL